ncbi:nucleotidyltransferase family protein [Paenibacillus qinlingensis]|uniref:nucleotidyltransferase family protein n=1 Tax=Paenibacillus qinlingensis TaxID=1837343 RepID=UPI0015657E90|nr:nucleotidyltransferase family protein [Paenibacillus qinlingensis]NQX61917.1 CBS domain-containing protein [Paenibacillus qinlingensis]
MNWRQVLVSVDTPIIDALKIIDEGGLQIALIADQNGILLGVITDGDVRRGILRGISLQSSVQEVMNEKPITAKLSDSRPSILELMKRQQLRHIPILDNNGKILNLLMKDGNVTEERDNWVILMAGGLGTRLRPLTDQCPKPLLNVGGKPLLETIIESFITHGFCKFYISVNYMADMIEDYFGDGSKWNIEIRYLRENERMGTAGSLSLLEEKPSSPFFVMNADILTKVNFAQLLDFHEEQKSIATMCVRDHVLQVPYGVVELNDDKLLNIKEKPVYSFFVNAGIYLLDPDLLKHIPKKAFFDMPTLFEKNLTSLRPVSAFPIREYWVDIGQIADYEKANDEFKEVFL